ncbi:hypothetical protein OUZ56_011934 [Daphnia magna]|uniref:Uncharacterized protein n=1 Tax=Daphnia magna TaxID=35525 RepID=A0ABQ9Z1Q3_9CRUS|nr:hypothetical protein OUZ56_011934 [Daphnia magna]
MRILVRGAENTKIVSIGPILLYNIKLVGRNSINSIFITTTKAELPFDQEIAIDDLDLHPTPIWDRRIQIDRVCCITQTIVRHVYIMTVELHTHNYTCNVGGDSILAVFD